MKTILFLLAVWGVLGLVQCKKDADADAQLNQEIQLRSQQRTSVAVAPGTEAQLSVTKIADSRCPSDVTCVWAGIAETTIELRDNAGVVQSAALYIGGSRRRDSTAVMLDAIPYWLHLLAVSPYPSKATQSVPRTATLRLTRQ